jgi:hypothetical protein
MAIGTLYSFRMTENTFKKSQSISTHALRIRWAAIGAAIAVSLGGGVTLFAQAGAAPASSSTFVAVSPVRVLDTRDDVVLWAGPFVTGVPHDVKVTGSIPTSSGTQTVMPAGSTGVVLNVTVLNSTADGFVSVRPADAADAPKTSNINFEAGKTVANSITVNLPTSGADAGTFEVWFDSMGVAGATADILVDVTGYYSASALDLKSDAIAIIGSGGEDFGDIQLTGDSTGVVWDNGRWVNIYSDGVQNSYLLFTSNNCSGVGLLDTTYGYQDKFVSFDGLIGYQYEVPAGAQETTLDQLSLRSVLINGECNGNLQPTDFNSSNGDWWFWGPQDLSADIYLTTTQLVGPTSSRVNAIWAFTGGVNIGVNSLSFVPRSSLNAAG